MTRQILPLVLLLFAVFQLNAQTEEAKPGICSAFDWEDLQSRWDYISSEFYYYAQDGNQIAQVVVDSTSGDTLSKSNTTFYNNGRTIITVTCIRDTATGELIKYDSFVIERDAMDNLVRNERFRRGTVVWYETGPSSTFTYDYNGSRIEACTSRVYYSLSNVVEQVKTFAYDGNGFLTEIVTYNRPDMSSTYDPYRRERFTLGDPDFDLLVTQDVWDSTGMQWNTSTRFNYNFENFQIPDFSHPNHYFEGNKNSEVVSSAWTGTVFSNSGRDSIVYLPPESQTQFSFTWNTGDTAWDLNSRFETERNSFGQLVRSEAFDVSGPVEMKTFGMRNQLTYQNTNELTERIQTFFNSGTQMYQNNQRYVYAEFKNFNSISETQLSEIDLKLFPNPSSDLVFIRHESDEHLTATLFSVAGQEIESLDFSAQTVIDLRHRSPGIYLFKVSSETGASSGYQLIKK